MLDAARIAVLLEPFLGGTPASSEFAEQLRIYLDLLLRWNARINLTAVRDPEQIVTRHFGESLFAARCLQQMSAFDCPEQPTLTDVGSGAGFPGIPIKLFVPQIKVTLLESHNKKATFLREAVRALGLTNVEVVCARAETWTTPASVVTLRAVENFSAALPTAARLVAPAGTLCLLVGSGQTEAALEILGQPWQFRDPVPIPQSEMRAVYMGQLPRENE